jgi:membrane protein implicated in regulation of membrane protease activity
MNSMNPFYFFVLLGTALVIAEIAIFNLSVFWFLFIGIGALITAVTVWLIPDLSWLVAWLVFVVASAVTTIALYSPVKKWQQRPSAIPGNDAIGQTVEVLNDITADKTGDVMWSGAKWQARLDKDSDSLKTGDKAEIISVTGISLIIKKI